MELQIFSNSEFGEIRTITKDDEPMFCLADVCKALELTQPSKVKERLNPKGVNSIPTLTKGGEQKLLYINESNLYKKSFRAEKRVQKDLQNGLHQKSFHQSERQEVTVSL